MADQIRILLADDHGAVREAMKNLVEKETDIIIAGEAYSGIVTRQKAKLLKPDIILMDISMPDLNGMAAAHLIKEENPKIRIIGLSVYCEKQYILGMLRAGAEGYLVKSDRFRNIISAISRILNGHIYLSEKAADVVFKDFQKLLLHKKEITVSMTDLEQKVFEAISAGKSLFQIAGEFNINHEQLFRLQTRFIKQWLSLT